MAKVQKISAHRLSENTNMSGFNIRKQSLEQDKNLVQDQNIAKKYMAVIYSKWLTKDEH